MIKKIVVCLMILMIEGALMVQAKDNNWDKTFPKNDKVSIQKVSFKNRYGIELVGDLYTPRNTTDKIAAIAVSGPFGAVKE